MEELLGKKEAHSTFQKDSNLNKEPKILVPDAYKAIKEGRYLEAENLLLDALENKSVVVPADVLRVYSNLIRIAAELMQFEKLNAYTEAIKNISVKNDAEKQALGRCIYNTGISWDGASDNKKALSHFENALILAKEVNDESLEFSCLIKIADLYRKLGRLGEANKLVEELKTKASSAGYLEQLTGFTIDPKVNLLHLEGNVKRKQGNFTEALLCFSQARELVTNRNSSTYYHILWAIGTCYAALEDLEKAEIYLNMTFNKTEGLEFWKINMLSKMTLAELYTVSGNYTKAEQLYNKIQEKNHGEESSYFGRRALRGQILLLIKKGEFEKANELIDKLVLISVKESKTSELMRLRLLKAEVLLRTGEAAQHDEARAMLQEAQAFYDKNGNRRYLAITLELLARLDSRGGFAQDSLDKMKKVVEYSQGASMERILLRAELAVAVLDRKLGKTLASQKIDGLTKLINKLNADPERTILKRFTVESYDEWSRDFSIINPHSQRYVNEFFEDFHFVPQQSVDLEIDKNSHYVREKHLGEIPFHNKFTLMRILLLLAETPGKEFSKEHLAKEIWGQEYNPLRHDNNIYININRLRKLIEPNPRESRYVMNGAQGYYLNPTVKVNISTKISDVAPRAQGVNKKI